VLLKKKNQGGGLFIEDTVWQIVFMKVRNFRYFSDIALIKYLIEK